VRRLAPRALAGSGGGRVLPRALSSFSGGGGGELPEVAPGSGVGFLFFIF